MKAATVLFVGLLLWVPSLALAQSLTASATAFVLAEVADLHSTHYARSRGAYESNPVMPDSFTPQAAVKVSASIATLYLASRLHRTRPRLARLTLWSATAVIGIVAARNYRIGARQ